MRLKALVDEDFVQYKVPSMFIGTCFCDWKCAHDGWFPESVCQNHELAMAEIVDMNDDELIARYLANDITHAIVFGGLEPMKQSQEILRFIDRLRNEYHCDDTVIIYTGYYSFEAAWFTHELAKYPNIIVKYGRYRMGDEPHFDEVLGVNLASDDQYAVKIS